MQESRILKQFYRLNRNVRLRYLETLAGLPREELLRDRGASYPTLLDVFVHVLDGYRFWILHVILGAIDTFANLEGKVRTLDEARRLEAEVGASVVESVEGFSERDLDRQVKLSWGGKFSRLGDICWHMVEEELQHRGEMNALLWQINVDPPIGEYEDWVRAGRRG